MPSFIEFVNEKKRTQNAWPAIPRDREDAMNVSIQNRSVEAVQKNIPRITKKKATKNRVTFGKERVDDDYEVRKKPSNKPSMTGSILRKINSNPSSETKRTITDEQRRRTVPSRESVSVKEYLQQRKGNTIF